MRTTAVGLIGATLALCALPTCSERPGTLPPDPPQVSVFLPESTVFGTKLVMNLTVSGCEVTKLELLERNAPVRQVNFAGNPTLVELPTVDIPFTRGIAAYLSFTAKVECADGRTGTSQPAAAVYFPVAQVITAPTNDPAAPEIFFAEGAGSGAYFLGCAGKPGGGTQLIRQTAGTGAITHANTTLPFNCSLGSWYTEKRSNVRWLVERDVGVMAFESDTDVVSHKDLLAVRHVGIGPDGHAITYNQTIPYESALQRIGISGGSVVWSSALTNESLTIGNPVVLGDATTGLIYFPTVVPLPAENKAAVRLQKFQYGDGSPDAGWVSHRDILLSSPLPVTAFSPDGQTTYYGLPSSNGKSTISACATTSDCTTLKWPAKELSGHVVGLLHYRNNLAVLMTSSVWFLDATTGDVISKGNVPVSATGSYRLKGVQEGKTDDSFYMFTGPTNAALPSEVVAIESPALGEVYRVDAPGGSAGIGIDDNNPAQVYIRINKKVVRPLSFAQYRALRGS